MYFGEVHLRRLSPCKHSLYSTQPPTPYSRLRIAQTDNLLTSYPLPLASVR